MLSGYLSRYSVLRYFGSEVNRAHFSYEDLNDAAKQ